MRSVLESKYQEVGPKGPLWEEISAGMQRSGYKRSAKRCKEKWENINKYFKKVKESNKKRPEDAKTCPYFHELDALYKKKSIGSSSSGPANQNRPEEPQQQHKESIMTSDPAKPDNRSTDDASASELQSKNGGADVNTGLTGSLFGEGNGGAGAAKKPEDIVKGFIQLQGTQKQPQQQQQQLMAHHYGKIEEGGDTEEDDDEEEEEEEEEDVDVDDEEDELEEEHKMAYKIEYQRQNTSTSNGGGNGAAPSFLAIVQ